MKRLIAIFLMISMVCCLFVGAAFAEDVEDETSEAATEEIVEATEEITEAVEEDTEAEDAPEATEESTEAASGIVEKETSGAVSAVKVILLVMQIVSCVALTVVIMFQSSKDNGLGALAGNSDNFMNGKNGSGRDAKLARMTKWIAAAFVLLTLFVSMLYTAA